MSGGESAEKTDAEQYSVGPLLERSPLDDEGVIEIGVNVAGTGRLDENDLDVLVPSPRIDPGERIEVGVFVSSVGEIEATDLSVFYDDAAVLDLAAPGVVRRNVATEPDGRTDRDENVELGPPDQAPHADGAADRDERTETGTQHVHSTTLREGDPTAELPLEYRPLEGSHQDDPAYILELNTRESAPPGEYRLPVVVTYRSDDGIKRMTRRPTIRIHNWRDRWQPWLVRLSLAGVVLGGFAWLLLAV